MAKKKRGKAIEADARQVAALPFKRTKRGVLKFLIMTSRQSRRFVIPKGWPMAKLRDYDAAAKEAFEEAGLVGKVSHQPIGVFLYWKRMRKTFRLIEVDLYPLKVTKQFKTWPEKRSRKIAWLTADDAILLLDEPRLKALIGAFASKQDSVQDSLES